MKKTLTLFSILLSFLISPISHAYTGASEFIVKKDVNTKMHIIDYYNVLVVLSIHESQFSNRNVQCGVFPLNQNKTATFGDNFVDFSRKDYALLNGRQYFYTDDKTHVSLYREQCKNFKLK